MKNNYEIYKAGFEAGQAEQLKRDFPDVGICFDKEIDEYWKEYSSKHNSEDTIRKSPTKISVVKKVNIVTHSVKM